MFAQPKKGVNMELRDYLHKHRIKSIDFAGELNMSVGYVRSIKNKRFIPSPKLAKLIEIVTGGEVTIQDLRGELDE